LLVGMVGVSMVCSVVMLSIVMIIVRMDVVSLMCYWLLVEVYSVFVILFRF